MFRPNPGPYNPASKVPAVAMGAWFLQPTEVQHWLSSVSGRAGASSGLQGRSWGPSRAGRHLSTLSVSSPPPPLSVAAQLTAVASITFDSPTRERTLLITISQSSALSCGPHSCVPRGSRLCHQPLTSLRAQLPSLLLPSGPGQQPCILGLCSRRQMISHCLGQILTPKSLPRTSL